jgi:hypothetical protein
MMGDKPKQTPCEKCRGYLLKRILGELDDFMGTVQPYLSDWEYDEICKIITEILGESSRES